MRRILLVLLPVAAVLVVLATQSTGVEAAKRTFVAHLTGAAERPDPVETRAVGQSIVKLSKDGDSLSFRLITAGLEDIVQAHIHCGSAEVAGPVVLFLFGPADPPVTTNGVLSVDIATNANVIPRPDSEECPGGVADFDDLVEKIQTGQAYVNVHTVENPGGEIRGQLR